MIMILFLENDILNVINDPCAILDLMMEMTLYVHIMHHEPITIFKKYIYLSIHFTSIYL